jgi:Fic family protein
MPKAETSGGAEDTMLTNDLGDWLSIIRSEFLEVPGLNLTRAQVRRLWNLDEATADALLEQLEASRFLRRTKSNRFVRA